MTKIKTTSYEYGSDYQNKQVSKYKNRANNHWQERINIFYKLLDEFALPLFENRKKSEITVVDIGCSIGTFALEAGRNGYNSIGIDFDKEAIEIAEKLAIEENVQAQFICGDVSSDIDFKKEIDIAVCFDIFEHLHDDELGILLQAIKKRLSKNGVLLYHTFPTKYDYIFFGRSIIHIPLIPFSLFGVKTFTKITKMYALIIDFFLLLFKNKTYRESIKTSPHCNLLSKENLSEILNRTGFENKSIEVSQLYNLRKKAQNRFRKQPISYRNLYGVAVQK
jgi:2-polyprenyl-3-methyl-5-hydroxy-6-metoxy-1,4-benzoquinol methylase